MQSAATYIGPYSDIIHAHRPLSRRVPMPVSHRAKQFAPFAALKGYEDSIHRKEEIYVPMSALSEESLEQLDRVFRLLKYHDKISLIYFQNCSETDKMLGKYKKLTGTVEFIDPLDRHIRIDDTEIGISDIKEINVDV